MSLFQQNIARFNAMYRLPVSDSPTVDIGQPLTQRLKDFKHVLTEELEEIDDIIEQTRAHESPSQEQTLDVLTNLADLLGDIQVYCASEMAKFGIPIDDTLGIIMQSNFSKLDSNQQPIYDARGKVLKGPSYWKPEPKIREMLFARRCVAEGQTMPP